jgi:hypothetical protein
MKYLVSAGNPDCNDKTHLRLKVFMQNLQLYGLSPESKLPISAAASAMHALLGSRECTHVAADVATDVPCAGTSFHIDCRSTGQPPSRRNHCGGRGASC